MKDQLAGSMGRHDELQAGRIDLSRMCQIQLHRVIAGKVRLQGVLQISDLEVGEVTGE